MGFKYSLACPTLNWMGYDVVAEPEKVLEAIKAAGHDGADLPVEGIGADAIQPILQAVGLEVPEVMGSWGYVYSGEDRDLSSNHQVVRQRGIDYSKVAIELAAQLGAKYFNVCASQPAVPQIPFPTAPIDDLRQNFSESLKVICDHAAARNITILLEPLNHYEAIPGVLTTVYDAIRIVDQLGYDNLGIQPDVFHMNISEVSISDALRAAGKRTHVVHINETHHYRVGTGHADFKSIIRTLVQCGFDGYVTVYAPLISQKVFQQRTSLPNLEKVLGEQLRYLKEIEELVTSENALCDGATDGVEALMDPPHLDV